MISLCQWKDPIPLDSDNEADDGCQIGAKDGKALSKAIPSQPSHLLKTLEMVNKDLELKREHNLNQRIITCFEQIACK